MIVISEDQLSNIINNYCSCGGRGPNDDPCDACAIWHELLEFGDQADTEVDEFLENVSKDRYKLDKSS